MVKIGVNLDRKMMVNLGVKNDGKFRPKSNGKNWNKKNKSRSSNTYFYYNDSRSVTLKIKTLFESYHIEEDKSRADRIFLIHEPCKIKSFLPGNLFCIYLWHIKIAKKYLKKYLTTYATYGIMELQSRIKEI